MITLHDYWRSSASYRVRIALNLAGLDYKSLPVDLTKGEQTSPEHRALNPQGLVPVLEIGRQKLTQSLAIIEYLEEVHGVGLLPDSAIERAHVRALAYAVAMEIHPVCNLRVAKFVTQETGGKISMEHWMQSFIAPGLAALEQMVGDGNYCHEDRVSLADICLVPQLYNARRWNVDLAAMPKLLRIGAHLETLPAFKLAHPDRFQ
ncbi:maleylacetoacetate isomerase [Rhizobium sp. L1K21]|uniref:maleylacetoacetate isomerase n=1 Tax=Rhizobium sp. L1K21 TaxID=2954933 RepID=UPI002092049F|nr:maleylacetoacetate isomerase [Rhizobium sp. L1K21]MCO6184656.1 maleylacetoacetate isomerase [Rhizobium sp. L1K21]